MTVVNSETSSCKVRRRKTKTKKQKNKKFLVGTKPQGGVASGKVQHLSCVSSTPKQTRWHFARDPRHHIFFGGHPVVLSHQPPTPFCIPV